VTPGMPLMVVVPLQQVWVNANFKESQLSNVRIGQLVRLTADLYGRNVPFPGKVAGLDAGTGSAFSLLPPQNATGNWIKVLQRVPVRIAIHVKQHPLRIGLSMEVSVETHDRTGEAVAGVDQPEPSYTTPVSDGQAAEADSLIQAIIRENTARDAVPERIAHASAPASPAEHAANLYPGSEARGARETP